MLIINKCIACNFICIKPLFFFYLNFFCKINLINIYQFQYVTCLKQRKKKGKDNLQLVFISSSSQRSLPPSILPFHFSQFYLQILSFRIRSYPIVTENYFEPIEFFIRVSFYLYYKIILLSVILPHTKFLSSLNILFQLSNSCRYQIDVNRP